MEKNGSDLKFLHRILRSVKLGCLTTGSSPLVELELHPNISGNKFNRYYFKFWGAELITSGLLRRGWDSLRKGEDLEGIQQEKEEGKPQEKGKRREFGESESWSLKWVVI